MRRRRCWVDSAVDELDREYTETDVTAVVSQLLRAAVREELKNVDRDLREGRMSPTWPWRRSRREDAPRLLETPRAMRRSGPSPVVDRKRFAECDVSRTSTG